MVFLHLTTFIAADPERVFDLSRSVSLHKQSMNKYQEQIVGGRSNGLMEEGESVTWKAKHLFKERILTVKMTQFKRPDFFVDEQEKGDFLLMKHEHYFKPAENGTIMIDQFRFQSPYHLLGRFLDLIYLKKYFTRLLTERNAFIKSIAESKNDWKKYVE
jgi:hypothetical protein